MKILLFIRPSVTASRLNDTAFEITEFNKLGHVNRLLLINITETHIRQHSIIWFFLAID